MLRLVLFEQNINNCLIDSSPIWCQTADGTAQSRCARRMGQIRVSQIVTTSNQQGVFYFQHNIDGAYIVSYRFPAVFRLENFVVSQMSRFTVIKTVV